jgi:membrane-bound lytic murein transglycosylase D
MPHGTVSRHGRSAIRNLFVAVLALALFACAPKATITNVTPEKSLSLKSKSHKVPSGEAEDDQEVDLEPELYVEVPESELDKPLTPEEQQELSAEGFTFDQRESREFLTYYNFYTGRNADGSPGKGRQAFERWLKRSELYVPHARKLFKERGLPEQLISLGFAESGYNPFAYSRSGAAGIWQFMPFTGKKYGLRVDWWLDERRDPYKSAAAAADYLTKLYEQFGDWYLAMAAYNAGEGKVARAIEQSGCTDYFEICETSRYLKEETRHYVPKIMAIDKILRNLEKLGFTRPNWEIESDIVAIDVKGGLDLQALAEASGMDWLTFQGYNPALRRKLSAAGDGCTIYLPSAKVAAAQAHVATAPTNPYAGFTAYKIRKGDSWYRIAKKYDVSIDLLRKYNPEVGKELSVGKTVLIPTGGGVESAEMTSTPPEKTRKIAQNRANYAVKRGDTPWAIAQNFKVDLDTFLKANGLTKRSRISVGQRLYIPSGGEEKSRVAAMEAKDVQKVVAYKVRPGDTVWSIARQYKVNPKQLLSWNNLGRDAVIKPGDTLKVYP